MVHYAINKPVGAKFGESDLAPMLRWLTRYASWLEDRARLNRYRNTFIFWVRARFSSQAEKMERQAELNRNPPNPGSILVTDESEEWKAISPNLSSFEAAEDGQALKKMIAVGAGLPMHFLAEPESATRTTAESAGGPTFRHMQQRQEFFLWMLEDLAKIVISRRKKYDRLVNPDADIEARGTDISARDNAALAAAASTVVGAFATLRDSGLIDDEELMRIAYRFAGEVVDLEELLKRGAKAPPPVPVDWPEQPPGRPGDIDIDPIRGEPEGLEPMPSESP
jgi:NADH dehydrogenase/NADH:ubiquinone oxidoreductase subunit G